MKSPFINISKRLKFIVLSLTTFIFCSINMNGQDFIGKELFTCSFFEDTVYFKFIEDTVYLKISGDENYSPISLYIIKGDTIIWNDLASSGECDPELVGEYIYVENSDSLVFHLIFDECEDREMVLSGILFKKVTLSNLTDFEHVDFNAYPNPMVNILSIETSDQKTYNFQLINIHGQNVLNGKVSTSDTYDIEWLDKGVYILRVLSQDNVIKKSIKLLKM